MHPSAEEIVDRFVHDARRPAFDEERLVLLRDAVTQMATLAPEAIAPHAVRILDALGNAFRVTGGDAAIDRMDDVLARLDASALEAALAERAASFDEVPRRRFLRELGDLAFACPSLHGVVAKLAPRPQAPAEDEAEVTRFVAFADALIDGLADNAALGSREAFCGAVREKLRSPEVFDRHVSLPWALASLGRSRFAHDAADDPEEIAARLATAFALGPNVEIRSLEVIVFVTVVDVLTDPATQITRAALEERHPDMEGVEIGDEVGLQDPERTRALRTAVLRAVGA